MRPYWQRGGISIYQGDVREVVPALPSLRASLVVTSPPYFWARDYGDGRQTGHEQTPEGYVGCLADVFDAIRSGCLSENGLVYLNLGDTYYSGRGRPHGSDARSHSRQWMRDEVRAVDRPGMGMPPKSLLGMPWRVALELQRRQWVLRSEIVWHRRNAMGESRVMDRPHRKHEHLFLLSASRFYHYDRDALDGEESVWDVPIEPGNQSHSAAFPLALAGRCIGTGCPEGGLVLDPFCGDGTTLEAAYSAGLAAVGIELIESHAESAAARLDRLMDSLRQSYLFE